MSFAGDYLEILRCRVLQNIYLYMFIALVFFLSLPENHFMVIKSWACNFYCVLFVTRLNRTYYCKYCVTINFIIYQNMRQDLWYPSRHKVYKIHSGWKRRLGWVRKLWGERGWYVKLIKSILVGKTERNRNGK